MAVTNRWVALLRSHHGWFWSASILVCLACYPDVIFGGRTFLSMGRTAASYDRLPLAAGYSGRVAPRAEIDPGSEAWMVHPTAYLERRALMHGDLPQWNRHNGLGHPALSNGQTGTLNPLHWIVLLNPDWPALWDLYYLALRFVAGLFGCYFLFTLGAPKELAVLAAPFGAVNGIFTIFLNRADLAGYALMPAVLFCLAALRRAPGLGRAVALAIAMYVCLTGGHPEPAFATLFVCGLVGIGLCALDGPPVRRYLLFTAAGAAMAALIAAPYWLPFLLRIPQSWSAHERGAGYGARPASVALLWLAPNAFAQGMRGLWDMPAQNFGFFGCFMGLLTLIGVLAAIAIPAFRRAALWAVGPILLALRIYGAPGTAWLGHLPLLDRMPFELYGQFPVIYPLGAFGMTGLAALIGASSRRQAIVVGLAAAVALEALLLAPFYADGLSPVWSKQLLLDINLILLAVALCWLSVSSAVPPAVRRLGRALLFAGVAAELVSYREHLSDRGNPTAIPPYARWLQERQEREGPFRTMGLGYTMIPNFATVFGLEDVRLCDALVSPEYVKFIRRFVQKDLQWSWLLSADPVAGFDLHNRALDWLNVRYVVGGVDAAVLPTRLELQVRASGHQAFEHRVYNIDGSVLPVLYQHPNDEGSVEVRVPSDRPILAFALAQDPVVWNAPGDGATYELAISRAGARPVTVYSRTFDPKNNPGDRHWLRDRIDLSRWKGSQVTFTLRARSANTASDWGGWGDLHWETPAGDREPVAGPLPIVFRDDTLAFVMDRGNVWPRVFAVAQPIVEASPDAVLEKIGALVAADGGPYAVVDESFPAAAWTALCGSGGCAPQRELHASIGGPVYGTNDVALQVKVDKPAVLVLSDLLMPGWTAMVDGQPQKIFPANYLFRGLLLSPGAHTVRMEYRPPAWRWALLLGVLGWVLAGAALFAERRRLTASSKA